MSLFCGIFVLDGSSEISPEWKKSLQKNISRSGNGSITEYVDPQLYVAKLDFGGFDSPGWYSDSALGVTALSGDSFLAGRRPSMTRTFDVEQLQTTTLSALPALLKGSRGTFSALAYRSTERALALATDKLGVRPIYFMQDGRYLIFAGALRLIEELPGVRLAVDLRAAMEAASFGFPMADRTPYSQIRVLRGGQLLTCGNNNGVSVSHYWRWDIDACATTVESSDAALANLHEVFAEAVRLRVGNRKSVFAGLTGGLDSRCVVTELRSQKIDVHSLNVSWQGTADQVLGALYAAAVGTKHHQIELPAAAPGGAVPTMAWKTMAENAAKLRGEGGNPRQLWGGDGGSVGMGHVYIKPGAVQAIREKGCRAGAQHFLADNSIAMTARPFKPAYADFARQLPLQSVTSELERLNCADPARALYVFLLDNDQRRHLGPHLENIDRLPFEFVEPFYDAEVLAAVCKLPMDFCIRHRMYGQWMNHFPPHIKQTAWQHYPGHEPCPIPLPSELVYQWAPEVNAEVGGRQRGEALNALRFGLANRSSLNKVLRSDVLAMLYLTIALRMTDAFYIGLQVDGLARRLVSCDGRFELQ